VVVALWLATYLRIHLPWGMQGFAHVWKLPPPVYFIAVSIYFVSATLLDIYHPQILNSLINELEYVIPTVLLSWFILLGLLYLAFREVSRLQMLYFLGFLLLLVVLTRIVLRLFFATRGHQRFSRRRVLVVGSGKIAAQLAENIDRYRWSGLDLVEILPDNLFQESSLDKVASLLRRIEQLNVDEVVLAAPRVPDFNLYEFVTALQELPISLRIVPDFFDLVYLQSKTEDFGGIPLIALKAPILTEYQRFVKRAFDLVVSCLLLIPALPLMGIIALLIKLNDGGPILFKQDRVGENGKVFKMFKFRSMVVNAEALQNQVAGLDREENTIYKRKDDPRVTSVGRILRRTSIDELPQLFNVIRGDMSLVGPRPELPALVEKYEPWQRKRFEVPQGITGWWQVNGRADKPLYQNVEEDLFYIRNYSLWLDIVILWRTIGAVISGRGAY